MKGVVNIRYNVNGLNFDAAVDYGYILHPYTYGQSIMLPVELYCLDHDWDIVMLYFANGVVEWDKIIERTCQWIKEMSE